MDFSVSPKAVIEYERARDDSWRILKNNLGAWTTPEEDGDLPPGAVQAILLEHGHCLKRLLLARVAYLQQSSLEPAAVFDEFSREFEELFMEVGARWLAMGIDRSYGDRFKDMCVSVTKRSDEYKAFMNWLEDAGFKIPVSKERAIKLALPPALTAEATAPKSDVSTSTESADTSSPAVAPAAIPAPRGGGRRPARKRHEKIARIIRNRGLNWKSEENLELICGELDDRLERALDDDDKDLKISGRWASLKPAPHSWIRALEDHKGNVIDVLEYELKEGDKTL